MLSNILVLTGFAVVLNSTVVLCLQVVDSLIYGGLLMLHCFRLLGHWDEVGVFVCCYAVVAHYCESGRRSCSFQFCM